MPVENLPHWTILPNWRSPVLERLECLTTVLGSPSGAEQRYAARWSPRRFLEPFVTPIGPLRTLFDMAVGAVGSSPWYVPVWHDGQTIAETIGIADTTLACDTLHREFVAGGFVMLWANEFQSEVVEVASVASGVLTFVAGPAASWPAGTRLYPAVKARMTAMPDMSRMGPRVIENSVRFMVETQNDYEDPDVTLAFPTYEDFPVLTTEPDEGQDITHGRVRLLEDLDGETGLSRQYDTANIDFTLQRHHWLSVGRQEHAELRTLFYTLDGRRGLLWLPTYADDLRLAASAGSTDEEIEVSLCGFTAFGGPRFGRDRIWIKMRDGTNIFRAITGSTLTIGGTEIIQLDDEIGVDLTAADVARISFMALSRLDSDIMEIEHLSDAGGASRVALNFRSAPNLRVGDDWIKPALPSAAMTAGECGELPPPPECGPLTYQEAWAPADPFDWTIEDVGALGTASTCGESGLISRFCMDVNFTSGFAGIDGGTKAATEAYGADVYIPPIGFADTLDALFSSVAFDVPSQLATDSASFGDSIDWLGTLPPVRAWRDGISGGGGGTINPSCGRAAPLLFFEGMRTFANAAFTHTAYAYVIAGAFWSEEPLPSTVQVVARETTGMTEIDSVVANAYSVAAYGGYVTLVQHISHYIPLAAFTVDRRLADRTPILIAGTGEIMIEIRSP